MKYILNKYHRNIDDDTLLSDLKNVAFVFNSESITIDEYNKHGKYHATTLTRRFGSWFKCLDLAGLKPSRSRLNISQEELFENLERLWVHFGRQPKYHEVKKPLSKFSAGTYEKRFGTYYNALEYFVAYVNGEIVDEKTTIDNSTKNLRSINYRLRFIVMQRDKFRCQICGASPANTPGTILHIDHIIPCAKGGKATIDNLQTLCAKCNLGKSDLDM